MIPFAVFVINEVRHSFGMKIVVVQLFLYDFMQQTSQHLWKLQLPLRSCYMTVFFFNYFCRLSLLGQSSVTKGRPITAILVVNIDVTVFKHRALLPSFVIPSFRTSHRHISLFVTSSCTSSSVANFIPLRCFFRTKKMWKSLSVTSELYGGCPITSHPNFTSVPACDWLGARYRDEAKRPPLAFLAVCSWRHGYTFVVFGSIFPH